MAVSNLDLDPFRGFFFSIVAWHGRRPWQTGMQTRQYVSINSLLLFPCSFSLACHLQHFHLRHLQLEQYRISLTPMRCPHPSIPYSLFLAHLANHLPHVCFYKRVIKCVVYIRYFKRIEDCCIYGLPPGLMVVFKDDSTKAGPAAAEWRYVGSTGQCGTCIELSRVRKV